jgi:predicted nuclease of predicted toxin-antitoxin system
VVFARDQSFIIASEDSDFRQLAFLNGPPPKVIWIRTGNVTTATIADLLRLNRGRIEAFVAAPDEALLRLPLTAIEGL